MKKQTCTGVIFLCLLVLWSPGRAVAQVEFAAPTTYSVGTSPAAIVLGDFNGDGKLDIAVADSGSNDVSILLGNGDGTFQPAVNFPAGNSPQSIAIGDFNGDGKLDLALFQAGSPGPPSVPGSVSILLGNGDGTFQVPITTALTAFATAMIVADFNLDKKSDLAVSNVDLVGSAPDATVSVLIGDGDGTFQSAKQTSIPPIPSGFGVDPLTAADFNGDGKPDIAVGTGSGILVLLGKGDGTFMRSATVAVSGDPIFIQTADFNHDGKVDLLVFGFRGGGCDGKCPPFSGLGIHLGNGDGTFQKEQILAQGGGAFVGDFNGDGKLDIAYLSSGGLIVQLGNGDGTFSLPLSTGMVGSGLHAVAGDFNGDNLSDLAVADPTTNTVSVFLNTTPNFTLSAQPTSISTHAGQQVSSVVTMNEQNGFAGSAMVSCAVTGSVPLPSCTVSPSPVVLGSAPATSMLTITVPSSLSAQVLPRGGGAGRILYAAVLLFPALFTLLGVIAGRTRKPRSLWLLGGSSILFALLAGCGGVSGKGSSTPPLPQNYTVTITAASGALQRSTTVALTVQ